MKEKQTLLFSIVTALAVGIFLGGLLFGHIQ
jgi:hypothetical protein